MIDDQSPHEDDNIVAWVLEGLEQPGKTQKGLAEHLGMSPSGVTMMLKGDKQGKRRRIKIAEVNKMAEYLGVPPPWSPSVNPKILENLEQVADEQIKQTVRKYAHEHLESSDIAALIDRLPEKQVPVVGYVGAGSKTYYFDVGHDAGAVDWVRAPKNSTDQTVALEVRGTSLGEVFNRWLVFFDDRRSPITDDLIGELCIVALPDNRLLVKKIEVDRNGGFILKSNTEEPIEVEEIVWAARVTHMEPR